MVEITKKVASTDSRSPRDNRGRRDQQPTEPKQYEELTINIDRVSRVVKGGRRFRFKALVVVGDKKTKVGIGVAKGADVQAAIAKATDVAKKHIITVAINKGTIPHDVEIRLSGAHILIKPAAPGTGIIAGGVVRSIIGVTGISDLLSKSLASTNKVNIAYATIEALRSLVPRDQWLNATSKKHTVKKEEVVEKPAKEEKPSVVKAKEDKK
jgi:small subunit ribosomal protein S5